MLLFICFFHIFIWFFLFLFFLIIFFECLKWLRLFLEFKILNIDLQSIIICITLSCCSSSTSMLSLSPVISLHHSKGVDKLWGTRFIILFIIWNIIQSRRMSNIYRDVSVWRDLKIGWLCQNWSKLNFTGYITKSTFHCFFKLLFSSQFLLNRKLFLIRGVIQWIVDYHFIKESIDIFDFEFDLELKFAVFTL